VAKTEGARAPLMRAFCITAFRDGEYKVVVQALDGEDEVKQPANWLILAMAHHRLGQEALAQRWWQRARAYLEDGTEGGESARAELSWNDRLELQIVAREAKRVLAGKKK